jgi:photosystem II stability/assembly factor-like uncharacterized protein
MLSYQCFRKTAAVFFFALAGCAEPRQESFPASAVESPAAEATEIPTATETPGWKEVFRTESVNSYSPLVAGFLDETRGITVGVSGEMHYSEDGGKTWSRGENESTCRFGLEIVDASLAWSVGNTSQVRVTRDGGKTWQAVANTPWKAHLVAFVDSKAGWAASLSHLAGTADGGNAWTEISLPEGVKKIAAIDRNEDAGYLLDDKGVLHVTQDGGATWMEKQLPVEKPILVGDNLPLAVLRFADPGRGVAVFSPDKSGGVLISLSTSDGGDTWVESTVPVKLGALFLTHDARFLTVLGGDGRIRLLRY